ncbi:hypothetical protein CLAIMM_07741 isoform 2, partial [Cladophialophora immunda]
ATSSHNHHTVIQGPTVFGRAIVPLNPNKMSWCGSSARCRRDQPPLRKSPTTSPWFDRGLWKCRPRARLVGELEHGAGVAGWIVGKWPMLERRVWPCHPSKATYTESLSFPRAGFLVAGSDPSLVALCRTCML